VHRKRQPSAAAPLPGGGPIRPILGFWGAKFPKMGDSLPRMPINHRAKFDAAIFILGGEIRNRTNTETHKKTTKTDIPTPCLSACVDNKRNGCVETRLD